MKLERATISILAILFAFGQAACAEGNAKSNSSVSRRNRVQELTRFSNDGKDFMLAVGAARVSIFNGEPGAAKALMEKAKASLQAAKKDAPSFNVKTTTSVQGRTVGVEQASSTAAMVPVDGRIVVDDDYVVNPEKQAHIDKANEHLKKGEAKEAIGELRLAQIDVDFNRTWVPIAASERHLDDAIRLANENKYYEANQALKAIEGGYTTDTVALIDPPKK
jgi:hypothetical protein